MSGSKDKAAPIIVKKIIKGGHGHHGGAWKVAYADFVTAMMAFFLLLWLLATTTPEQRRGLADFFTPTIGLKDSKGIGFEGGISPNVEGTSRTVLTDPGIVAGQVKQGPTPQPPTPQRDTVSLEETESSVLPTPPGHEGTSQEDEKTKQENEAFKQVEQQINSTMDQMPELQQMRQNVIITNTPEGLKIDVVDDPKKPLFAEGTAKMTDTGRLMFRSISAVILKTPNRISLIGHTETMDVPVGELYTPWELSADRANATRRYLAENLLEPSRISKVAGVADRELLLPKEPHSTRNRYISVLLLRGTTIDVNDVPASRDLLSVPQVDTNALKPVPKVKPEKLSDEPLKEPVELPVAPDGSIFKPNAKDEVIEPAPDAPKIVEQPKPKRQTMPKGVPGAPVVVPEEPKGPSIFSPEHDNNHQEGFKMPSPASLNPAR